MGALALLIGVVPRVAAQETHTVHLEGSAEAEEFRFVPAKVTARPGDVLKFVVKTGAPHNISIEKAGLSPAVREAWSRALPGRIDELGGPLLRQAGAEYRIVVPRVPPGSYRFYCLPHRSYHMDGELVVR